MSCDMSSTLLNGILALLLWFSVAVIVIKHPCQQSWETSLTKCHSRRSQNRMCEGYIAFPVTLTVGLWDDTGMTLALVRCELGRVI